MHFLKSNETKNIMIINWNKVYCGHSDGNVTHIELRVEGPDGGALSVLCDEGVGAHCEEKALRKRAERGRQPGQAQH